MYKPLHPVFSYYLCFLALLCFLITSCKEEPPPSGEAEFSPRDIVAPFPAEYPADELKQWNDRVYYQIFVRSFYDSDGDGIGDLRGVIQKLDYLNDGDSSSNEDLGVTGIWLMPINESPSYHGYDVLDYYSIHSEYGSLGDFRELLAEAGKRGIRVIIDLVLNHTSSEHPWFLAAKQGDPQYRDYYIWEDTNPATIGPWGQRVWHAAGDGGYYYGLFWEGMPDLNYWNPALTEEMNEIVRFWLEDVGVHGFRLDAIMYLREEGDILMNSSGNHEWFQLFHEYYKGINPEAFTIGEVWTDSREVVRYVGNEVDTAFDFDLAEAMLNAADRASNNSLINQQEKVISLYPEGQYGRFLSNHDQRRSATVLDGDLRKQEDGGRSSPHRPRHSLHLLRRGDRGGRKQTRRASAPSHALVTGWGLQRCGTLAGLCRQARHPQCCKHGRGSRIAPEPLPGPHPAS